MMTTAVKSAVATAIEKLIESAQFVGSEAAKHYTRSVADARAKQDAAHCALTDAIAADQQDAARYRALRSLVTIDADWPNEVYRVLRGIEHGAVVSEKALNAACDSLLASARPSETHE